MTTTPENTNEPADLSELAATDALLDRLGARAPSADDLLDPTAAVLTELLAAIDQSREPDVDAARLIEVLAGRPLYIAGADPAVDEAPFMIDLTEHEDPADDAGSSAEQTLALTRLPKPAVVPIRVPVEEPVGARRWDRALSHVSLPAASVLLLIAVGGGVSAAVTGNPMTPVNGITRVMAQLPGVSDGSLDKVKTEISAARDAASKRNAPLAYAHLDKAKAILVDVPDSDKPNLTEQIAAVEVSLPSTLPAIVPGEGGSVIPTDSGAGPVVTATSAPGQGAQPPGSAAPTVEVTKPSATVEPSSDPGPTTAPSAADPAPSTQAAAAEPTAAAVATSP